jgi:L-alanine-DL-glutamate epimerase-like enolase superfamily enzyme
MKIAAVESRLEAIPLQRPYTITFRTVTAIETVVVVLRDEQGRTGLGAASPESHVTGETNQACQAALAPGALDWLIGRDLRTLPALARQLGETMAATPAARAAVDMALHDLLARALDLPLCDLLGRAHRRLPTSITIGIKNAEETLREADEYLARGFRAIKVKVGRAFDEDLDRLRQLRAHVGPQIALRADANQGYTLDQTRRFLLEARALGLELVEQPVAARQTRTLVVLPEEDRRLLVADESLLSPADAFALALPPAPCGVYNIKLMKCGGVSPALQIASVADLAGLALMWGCMDESRIGIGAALHTAFACPATRYLDLDGSFDLAHDVVTGGFDLDAGCLTTTAAPGLGVDLAAG